MLTYLHFTQWDAGKEHNANLHTVRLSEDHLLHLVTLHHGKHSPQYWLLLQQALLLNVLHWWHCGLSRCWARVQVSNSETMEVLEDPESGSGFRVQNSWGNQWKRKSCMICSCAVSQLQKSRPTGRIPFTSITTKSLENAGCGFRQYPPEGWPSCIRRPKDLRVTPSKYVPFQCWNNICAWVEHGTNAWN